MKTALRLTLIVLTIGLLTALAYAQDPGPGYGTDPDLDPPRAGVGNANSGNHNMHIHSHWYRWGTLDDLLSFQLGSAAEDPLQSRSGFRYGPGDGTGYQGDGPADGTGYGPGTGDCVNDGPAAKSLSRRGGRR